MRDVTAYLRGDPEERLRDALTEEEETVADRLDRLQAEPRGRHHLDCGSRCTCEQCVGTANAVRAHGVCGHKGPQGYRCNRVVGHEHLDNAAAPRWPRRAGGHCAFNSAGELVQW